MALFATKKKGDLETIKKELINVVNSFFIPYKANFNRIKSSMDILSGANQELQAFEKKLKGTIKEGETFPEQTLTEEEQKEIEEKLWKTKKATQEEIDFTSILESELKKETLKKSDFGRALDEVRAFLDGAITIALTNYELQVVKPLKEFTEVLNAIINKILKKLNEEYYTLKFSSSEFDALKELVSYILEYADEFEKDCDEVITGIISQKWHRLEKVNVRKIRATELLTAYNYFLNSNKERIQRLNDNIKLITDSLKLLNKESIRLIKAF